MKILPNYEKHPTWERYEKELDVEYKQSVEEGKDIEVKCHFCNTAYNYTVEDLQNILKRSRK